ncbi:Mu transposase C-terminal domain-containing protein [Desulfitobacterium metallireducens]|uniref:Mu transposase C-terminal domain-containing protein n=1 Tax=Desulfitobacterium metallireducens TaxID=142877 RepID=UPI001438BC36|nr:Mu transposase C-terminal domain-containing protein [Desulfitobacterium metallireducens]
MENIFVNSIIEWQDDNRNITVERILWVSPNCSQLVIIDISDLSHLPEFREYKEIEAALEHGIARKLSIDPYSNFMRPVENISENSLKNRDKAWNIISNIVEIEPDIYDERRRGKLIDEVCRKFGIHKKMVYRYLKRYWVRGKTKNALLPNYSNCGAPGKEKNLSSVKLGRPRKVTREDPALTGINVNEIDKKNIRIAIKQWYLNTDQNSMAFAYKQMLENHYNSSVYFKNGVPIPILPSNDNVISFVQFRYWAQKEISKIDNAMQRRIGERKYNLQKRPLLGNSTSRASGPGAIFEIDATPTDVYLVSELDRKRIIGRAVLYIVEDVFTRLITGIYVGLEGPSWIGAMMALENAANNKVEFCAQYSIQIDESDWPCHSLPKSITGDRGEMEGKGPESLNDALGVRLDNTPPYRGDLKGIVEQNFRMGQRKIGPFVPGLIRKEIRERGEPDYRLCARLTVKAFTKIMIFTILEHNKKELHNYPLDKDMTVEGIPPIPLELWDWGIVNRSGFLHEKPRDIIRLNLLPRSEVSVTRQGIYFEKMYYGCDIALAEGWYEKATNRRFRVPICYDPRNMKYIYIPNRDGTEFIKCQRLPQFDRFDDMRLEEIQDQFFFEEVESHRRKTGQNQIGADTDAQIKTIIKEETELTEEVWPKDTSKASKLKDIKMNRKEEKEAIRQREAWELGEDILNQEHPAEVIPISRLRDSDKENITGNQETDPIMEMLQLQRNKRRK